MPVEIVNYIKENFQKHRILKAVKEMDDDKMEFEIKLSKKVELEFDERFQIKEIEVKNGIPLISFRCLSQNTSKAIILI